MTIIERKEPEPDYPKKVVCKFCQSILQLDSAADVKAIPDTATTKQGKGFTCPVCLKVQVINI